ncbi:MAG: Bax inhibitor-1/YccA family protein [Chitinophagales bacterium]|nr:Bax inhibitor-1/YccA family protein [Chitinophagales bacterium]
MDFNSRIILDAASIEREQASFITKVYTWMTVALVITAFVAMFTASSPFMLNLIFSSRIVFWGLVLGQLGMVVYLSSAIGRMSANTATIVFLLYSVVTGLVLSSIFVIFTAASIASTFFVTAGTFGAMSMYGYFTKRDLTKLGSLLVMALIGLVIASIVNWFWANSTLYWITTYAGILIFVGLIAYDTQKIKAMNVIGNEGTDEDRKEAIMGALTLYLDFINLFLYLLRLLGSKK